MSIKSVSKSKGKKRASSVAIGTWPTPEKARRKKKVAKRKSSPRAIDTVPLPEKPKHKKKKIKKKMKSKRK